MPVSTGRQQFGFFASKVQNDWYWWELVVLSRKALLVVIAMFNSRDVERGWFMMSFVQVFAIIGHLVVQPYRQGFTNLYESLCLLSAFVVFQSSMAFTFEELDPTREMQQWLLVLNQIVIGGAISASFFAEVQACREVYGGLMFALQRANEQIAITVLDSSEKIAGLQLLRDEAETQYLLHTITDEAERLAHGGKKARRVREKHVSALPDDHDEIKAKIDDAVYYKAWQTGHLTKTTADQLPQLLLSGEVSHHTLAWCIGMPPYAVPLSECEEHFGLHGWIEQHLGEKLADDGRQRAASAHDLAMLESISVDEQTLSVVEHSEGDALDDDDDASALTRSTSTASLDDSLLELVTELAAVMGGASAAKAQAALDDALRAQRHAEVSLERSSNKKEKKLAAAEVTRSAAAAQEAQAEVLRLTSDKESGLYGGGDSAAKKFLYDMIHARARPDVAHGRDTLSHIQYDANGRRIKRSYDRLSLVLEQREKLVAEEKLCLENGNLDRMLEVEDLIDACNKVRPSCLFHQTPTYVAQHQCECIAHVRMPIFVQTSLTPVLRSCNVKC
jgi:hypothetical protein